MGVFLILAGFFARIYLVKCISTQQRISSAKKDQAIVSLQEIFNNIIPIRANGMESLFLSRVVKVRRHYLVGIILISALGQLQNILEIITMQFTFIIVYLQKMLQGSGVSVALWYVNLSWFALLVETIREALFGIQTLLLVRVLCERTNYILALKELKNSSTQQQIPTQFAIELIDCHFCWDATGQGPVFTIANFKLSLRQTVIVTGPPGSGKSSLLHAIVGKMKLLRGHLMIGGNVSFMSQQPWLFEGTIRQNIILNKNWNTDRYHAVLRICHLVPDIELMDSGDLHMVGSTVHTVSGGQKQRIALARTLYNDADVYLFDDPFSAVDSFVKGKIFENLQKFLGTKST